MPSFGTVNVYILCIYSKNTVQYCCVWFYEVKIPVDGLVMTNSCQQILLGTQTFILSGHVCLLKVKVSGQCQDSVNAKGVRFEGV